jgi:hypothetical protein
MVYRIDPEDIVCILHSTRQSGFLDLGSGDEKIRGVQLNVLSQVLGETNKPVWFRNIMPCLNPARKEKLIEFRQKMKGVKYENLTKWQSLKELMLAGWGLSKGSRLDRAFCSELLASAYQFLGILLDDRPANSYAPHHFASNATLSLNPESKYSFRKMIQLR